MQGTARSTLRSKIMPICLLFIYKKSNLSSPAETGCIYEQQETRYLAVEFFCYNGGCINILSPVLASCEVGFLTVEKVYGVVRGRNWKVAGIISELVCRSWKVGCLYRRSIFFSFIYPKSDFFRRKRNIVKLGSFYRFFFRGNNRQLNKTERSGQY